MLNLIVFKRVVGLQLMGVVAERNF